MTEKERDMTSTAIVVRLGDPVPAAGTHVALGCPSCDWRSLESVVIDQPNGAWFAYKGVSDQWFRHWDGVHAPYRPRPDHLIVEHDDGPCRHCNDEGVVHDMAGNVLGPCDCAGVDSGSEGQTR